MQEHIRNFCIIAHIDHGKSTLADRFLDITGTVEQRNMKEQFLDQMDLEREKGITIKMQPVKMIYKVNHFNRGNNADSTQKTAESNLLYQDLTYKIRGILFQVRKNLGLGHKEQVYHSALEIEFQKAEIKFQSKKNIPIMYEGKHIGTYQPDFIIGEKVILELKALPEIGRPQTEQLWGYLKGCDYKLALLANFGSKDLEVKRIVYDTARQDDSALSASSLRDSAGVSNQVEYILNLIDTPGHADFSYEVSRSLAAVEGAILLVDATKGVQAQTLAHYMAAKAQNLVIVPAVNKIDAPLAQTEEVKKQVAELTGADPEDILLISAKEGTNVKELLDRVIKLVPPPNGEKAGPLRALIFDSKFDAFRGILAYVRIVDGSVKKDDKVVFLGTKETCSVKEVGVFLPGDTPIDTLSAGEIGYIATGVKNAGHVRIGDTVSVRSAKEMPLPGYQIPRPMVFASLYPVQAQEFDLLKDSLARLQLNDPSLTFEMETKEALGRGFRCGFLGILHSEIVTERVLREYGIEVIISRPSVEFRVTDQKGKEIVVRTPSDFPSDNRIQECMEPWARLEVLCPVPFFSSALKILEQIEGTQLETRHIGEQTLLLVYEVPLREIVGDLYERLKSGTQGWASMDYEVVDWRKANLVKLEFRVAGNMEEAFASIVPQEYAHREGKKIVEKLRDLLPPQQFEVPLQAMIGGKVVARETIRARRKDVTAPLYGGDITRKRKLLDRQKKGKKEMRDKGQVHIPSKVFFDVFRSA